MGKAKRSKSSEGARDEPYSATSMQVDESNADDDMLAALDEVDNEVESEGEKASAGTRGAILQRHKQEWKQVKAQMEELRRQSAKLSKANHKQKEQKRLLTKQMQKLKSDMEERHRGELSAFEYVDAF
jgi:iron-sulfur cluster repair protein YtfE (RIC family)